MRTYLGLGANLGQAKQTLKAAMACLATQPEITGWAASSLYRTAPINAEGDDYYNAVVGFNTTLCADELLSRCQQIEAQFGRQRPYPCAPRTLDIDILLYGQFDLSEPHLTIPHPRLTRRAFVLVPLLELDPDIIIPGYGPARAFLAEVASQVIKRQN
jgi:2-amino-4-hydroxy-6-hydroxymethyldihydropteridine diphosphokinase